MRKVTKEEFYAVINPLDVVVRSERMQAIWELRNRTVVGRTAPGYLCRDTDGNYTAKTEYFLAA